MRLFSISGDYRQLLPVSQVPCSVSSAQCPVFHARCPVPSAQCPIPGVQCPVFSAQCPVHSEWDVSSTAPGQFQIIMSFDTNFTGHPTPSGWDVSNIAPGHFTSCDLLTWLGLVQSQILHARVHASADCHMTQKTVRCPQESMKLFSNDLCLTLDDVIIGN